MATRHRLLSATALAAFNAHLAFEGATCCLKCREVYLTSLGECPGCLAQQKAASARALEAQAKRRDQQRLQEASEARSQRVERAARKPAVFDIRRSPLWDSLKGSR